MHSTSASKGELLSHVMGSGLAFCLIHFLAFGWSRQKARPDPEPCFVLQGKAYKDPSRRRKFIQSVTKRFQLESYVSAIQGLGDESQSADAIDAKAVKAF
jgi:hypothetical protein